MTPQAGSSATLQRLRLLLPAMALLLAACAGTPQADRVLASFSAGQNQIAIPAQVELENVPFFPQEAYFCGPAALAMVLAWGGVETTQDEIAEIIYTPGRQGTLRSDVLGGARRHGRVAVTVNTLEDLLREVAAGHPVIVFQNLGLDWYQQWHFAVVIGYDLDSGDLILHSGFKERKVTPLSVFENTWRRGDFWALVVLPPDRLPVTAEEHEVLSAAAAIERVGEQEAALSVYVNMARRWPDSPGARFGRGNVLYAKGDLRGAAAAFRDASRVAPKMGATWNNLAVVLSELGRRDEAISAARTAIQTGTGDVGEFRRTLAEIEGQKT